MENPEVLGKDKPEQNLLANEGNRMSEILAAQARANVQAHYLIAQNNKRDWDEVRVNLLALCDIPRFAENAFKRKPGIAEPMLTIRFAEAAQQLMGNLEPTRMIVFEGTTQRIVRLGLSDLETNNHPTRDLVIEKVVERKKKEGRTVLNQRFNSYGEVVYLVEATEDEMFTKESAWGSKWERQLTFKHLPANIRYECEDRCLETQQKADRADPTAARKKLIDSFFAIGVRPDQLKDFLGVDSLDNLTPADLQELRMVYTAIREGDTNWREAMETRDEMRGTTEKTGKGEQPASAGSSAANKAKAAAAEKASKATKKEPSAAAPSQTQETTPSTAPQTGNGSQGGTQEKSPSNTSQQTTGGDNPDAEPAGDLFGQTERKETKPESKPGPVAVEKPKASAPPPIDDSEW